LREEKINGYGALCWQLASRTQGVTGRWQEEKKGGFEFKRKREKESPTKKKRKKRDNEGKRHGS